MQANVVVVPAALRVRLGAEPTADLDQFVREASLAVSEDVVERAIDRFDQRLTRELGAVRVDMAREVGQLRAEIAQAAGQLRGEIAQATGQLRAEIAASRADLIRWMFIFWSGQVLLTLGMFAAFRRR